MAVAAPAKHPTRHAGPPGRFLTGHLAQFRADRLGFFLHCARTYGDVVPLRILHRKLLLLSRPDLIEQVLVVQAKNFMKHFGLLMYKPILGNGLVTSEGDFWRRQRKLSAPAFQAARLPGYARIMSDAAENLVRIWQKAGREENAGRAGARDDLAGRPLVRDVHSDMMRLSLEIACRTLFGADACPEPELVGQAMDQGLWAISARFSRLLPVPDWFPAPSNLKLRRSLRALDRVVVGVVNRRRDMLEAEVPLTSPARLTPHTSPDSRGSPFSSGSLASAIDEPTEPDDLLSILLRARHEDGSAMPESQLLDEVRTLFLAGHETTALALTYSLHLLAEHPGAQAELHAELASALSGRAPGYDDLPRLAYARKVVTEAMRLYPPADVVGREALVDCEIGGVPVSKGTTLFMSQWVMHHDPRYFPNPQAFDPSRWTDAFERSLPRFAYFPFGGGPRFCIGQTFALTEAVLVLAALCQRFAFAPDPTFRLQLWPSITLRPLAGLRLRVLDRETNGARS